MNTEPFLQAVDDVHSRVVAKSESDDLAQPIVSSVDLGHSSRIFSKSRGHTGARTLAG